jgi:hypothetical protein
MVRNPFFTITRKIMIDEAAVRGPVREEERGRETGDTAG